MVNQVDCPAHRIIHFAYRCRVSGSNCLTALIIGIEELIALVVVQRPINTYTNVYGNALQTVLWHFLIVFSLVSFWSAVDTFIPAPPKK